MLLLNGLLSRNFKWWTLETKEIFLKILSFIKFLIKSYILFIWMLNRWFLCLKIRIAWNTHTRIYWVMHFVYSEIKVKIHMFLFSWNSLIKFEPWRYIWSSNNLRNFDPFESLIWGMWFSNVQELDRINTIFRVALQKKIQTVMRHYASPEIYLAIKSYQFVLCGMWQHLVQTILQWKKSIIDGNLTPDQRAYRKINCFGCDGLSSIIWWFSEHQMRQFCLFTNPSRENLCLVAEEKFCSPSTQAPYRRMYDIVRLGVFGYTFTWDSDLRWSKQNEVCTGHTISMTHSLWLNFLTILSIARIVGRLDAPFCIMFGLTVKFESLIDVKVGNFFETTK